MAAGTNPFIDDQQIYSAIKANARSALEKHFEGASAGVRIHPPHQATIERMNDALRLADEDEGYQPQSAQARDLAVRIQPYLDNARQRGLIQDTKQQLSMAVAIGTDAAIAGFTQEELGKMDNFVDNATNLSIEQLEVAINEYRQPSVEQALSYDIEIQDYRNTLGDLADKSAKMERVRHGYELQLDEWISRHPIRASLERFGIPAPVEIRNARAHALDLGQKIESNDLQRAHLQQEHKTLQKDRVSTIKRRQQSPQQAVAVFRAEMNSRMAGAPSNHDSRHITVADLLHDDSHSDYRNRPKHDAGTAHRGHASSTWHQHFQGFG